MKLSYFMMPVHHRDKDYRTSLAEDTEAIALADRLGFEEAWVGEHHTSSVEPITSPLLFMANLIARTKRIKLATGVICAPQYHPALVAGHAAMFDHLAQGRFVMGIGPGGLPSDFELFGVADADRNAMMIESLDTILEIWSTDPPYDIRGKYWTTKVADWAHDDIGLGRMVRPLQKPHPPIAISAMSPSSGSMRFAAARGYEAISANFVAGWAVKTHWETYAGECEARGVRPDPSRWRVARSVFVADSDVEAEDFVKDPNGSFAYYYDYLLRIFDRAGMRALAVTEPGADPGALTSAELVDKLVVRGSAKSVTERILAFRDEVGPFGHLAMTAHDWTDKRAFVRSMEAMAREVAPALTRAGA